MRSTSLRTVLLLFVVSLAVPMFAAIGADVTLPAAGQVNLPSGLSYRTELVVTNHRDEEQYIAISFIIGGYDQQRHIFPLGARETAFLPSAGFSTSRDIVNQIGALRVRAIESFPGGDSEIVPDPLGQIEATAFIVADRGRSGGDGSSRQEIAAIPSQEYHAEEAVFLGVRHSYGTGAYTNVGITNLHPTQTETFFVQFQYSNPFTVVVPPLSSRQVRVPGEGAGGRWVRIYPEWSIGDGAPERTTPWVAYASTVDMQTGDAFSGIRVPPSTKYNRIDE